MKIYKKKLKKIQKKYDSIFRYISLEKKIKNKKNAKFVFYKVIRYHDIEHIEKSRYRENEYIRYIKKMVHNL